MGRKRTADKEMEFEDAPSGYVKLYDYKEPFIPFYDESLGVGYGFRGAVAFDGDSDKIQCHFCGNWYGSLPHHIAKEHNMKASEYKERVGLRQTTALINESTREKLIATGQERFKNLRPGGKMKEETKEKIRKTLQKRTWEHENETATCPAQLIERFKSKWEELGRQPRYDECGFKTTAVKVFGSWNNFIKEAGGIWKINQWSFKKKPYETIPEEKIVEFYRDYYVKYGKLPSLSNLQKNRDSEKYTWANEYFKLAPSTVWKRVKELGEKKIKLHAMCKTGDINACKELRKTKGYKTIGYTKSMLVDFMHMFERNHGRRPSLSDAKRGLLPHHSTYYSHFGTFTKALKVAFPEAYE
jgi:hypothetical protein